MLDDFFTRALIAGIGIGIVAGPLGCVIVWRRMAYFGATLAHSALLGVAVGLALGVDPLIGVALLSALVVPLLVRLQGRPELSSDTILGIVAHGTLALGVLLFGLITWVRTDLIAYLFGDILAVSTLDLILIWGGGAIVLGILAYIWRPLLAATVSPEIAAAEGLAPDRQQLVFTFLIAAVITIAMKVVGILLILSLLIIPPAAARTFASTPEQMALGAIGIGVASAIAGLLASLQWDTASGPSIVVAALVLFLLSLAPRRLPGFARKAASVTPGEPETERSDRP